MFVIIGAQDAAATWDLGSAWHDYKLAVESQDIDAIVSAARQVLEIGEQEFPASDERLAIVTKNYGLALQQAMQYEEARKFLDLALDRFEAIYGKDSVALIPVLQELADAEASSSEPGSQSSHYTRATKIAAAEFGATSTEYADVLYRTGTSLSQGPRPGTGKNDLKAAYEIYATALGPDNVRTADTAYYLGKIEFFDRRYRKAERQLLAALDGYDAATTIGHQRQLLTRELLVQTYEFLGDSGRATEQCIAIGQMNMSISDQDYQPLFRFPPDYPIDMLSNRKEGHVVVGFTVDADGFVRNPIVLTRTGGHSFERAALEAVERFRYAPKFVDGQPVATKYVKTRITFRIE